MDATFSDSACCNGDYCPDGAAICSTDSTECTGGTSSTCADTTFTSGTAYCKENYVCRAGQNVYFTGSATGYCEAQGACMSTTFSGSSKAICQYYGACSQVTFTEESS